MSCKLIETSNSGGGDGERGANYWVKKNENGSERWITLGPKNMVSMEAGDRCVIHTPGGGAWGEVSKVNSYPNCKPNGLKSEGQYIPRAAGSLAAWEETQGGSH